MTCHSGFKQFHDPLVEIEIESISQHHMMTSTVVGIISIFPNLIRIFHGALLFIISTTINFPFLPLLLILLLGFGSTQQTLHQLLRQYHLLGFILRCTSAQFLQIYEDQWRGRRWWIQRYLVFRDDFEAVVIVVVIVIVAVGIFVTAANGGCGTLDFTMVFFLVILFIIIIVVFLLFHNIQQMSRFFSFMISFWKSRPISHILSRVVLITHVTIVITRATLIIKEFLTAFSFFFFFFPRRYYYGNLQIFRSSWWCIFCNVGNGCFFTLGCQSTRRVGRIIIRG
mmetsp:Transcript_13290/g.28516  ORF Transcript_13290/g.28516 Transcript_13290/m.28516 type:complete len:283 (+) Transcript_13290:1771-2619(+)